MASDGYRLEPLRDVRERAEAVRRGDLVSAVGDARVTETGLAETRARTAAIRRALALAILNRDGSLATSATLVRAEHYLTRLRRDLDAAIGEEVRAEAAHDTRLADLDFARGKLRRARAEREVIERHFATWREARRKLAERRED